jgi:hypothetical protein
MISLSLSEICGSPMGHSFVQPSEARFKAAWPTAL